MSSDELSQLVAQFCSDEAAQACVGRTGSVLESDDAIVAKLPQALQGDLTRLVEALGDKLTSAETAKRRRATALFGHACGALAVVPLSALQYLEKRLSDFHCVVEVIDALHTAVPRSDAPADFLISLAHELLAQCHVSAQTQRTRQRLFVVLQHAFAAAVRDRISVPDTMVQLYCAAMTDEKDPRCLMLNFASLALLTKVCRPVHSSLVFEATACYFPITFRPPRNDPIGISQQDLKQALRGVLACHADLLKHVVPFLLDQVVASSSARVDALDTLTHVLNQAHARYASSGDESPRVLRPMALRLYTVIADALFGDAGRETDTRDSCLRVVHAGTRVLLPTHCAGFALEHADAATETSDFCEAVLNDARKMCDNADTDLARLCGRLAAAFAAASPVACRQVQQQVVLPRVLPSLSRLSSQMETHRDLSDTVQMQVAVSRMCALLHFLTALVRGDATVRLNDQSNDRSADHSTDQSRDGDVQALAQCCLFLPTGSTPLDEAVAQVVVACARQMPRDSAQTVLRQLMPRCTRVESTPSLTQSLCAVCRDGHSHLVQQHVVAPRLESLSDQSDHWLLETLPQLACACGTIATTAFSALLTHVEHGASGASDHVRYFRAMWRLVQSLESADTASAILRVSDRLVRLYDTCDTEQAKCVERCVARLLQLGDGAAHATTLLKGATALRLVVLANQSHVPQDDSFLTQVDGLCTLALVQTDSDALGHASTLCRSTSKKRCAA
ncbi:MAG: hypothetical protein MHM6MM_004038 [Cercozoa sp. M6MM]